MKTVVLDTSALIAVLQREPTAERLIDALENATVLRISAVSLVEAALVMQARYGDPGEEEVDRLAQRLGVEVCDVTLEHAALARRAYRRFGKGRHPAALNFGDCFAYALAVSLQAPLLFVGEDFSRTDVAVAAY